MSGNNQEYTIIISLSCSFLKKKKKKTEAERWNVIIGQDSVHYSSAITALVENIITSSPANSNDYCQ